MGKARGLGLIAALALAGCGGSSAPKPQTLRLVLPLVPTVVDPAKATDLPSLNVSHELYAGLTRFSGTGVEPDLAESWDVGDGGLVWTFHLRKGIRWSDDTPITAGDFRRSWLRALRPSTNAPYAGPELGIVRGARHLHATGKGSIGVQVLDDRNLRVTLQHPVPWLDELAAFPVAAPVPPRPRLYRGPFRLASRTGGKLVLERNFNYWNAGDVKPSRLVLSTATTGAEAVLPRQLAGPGLPWIDTAGRPPARSDQLQMLATGQVWFDTHKPPLNDLGTRQYVAFVITHVNLGTDPVSFVPPAMPGASIVNSHARVNAQSNPRRVRLRVAWAQQDVGAARLAAVLRRRSDVLGRFGLTLSCQPVAGVAKLEAQDADLTLLGWSSKIGRASCRERV